MSNAALYVVLLAAVVSIVSNAFLSDIVKMVEFSRAVDGSNSLDYTYEGDDGPKISGKTISLHNNDPFHGFFRASDDVIYWFQLDEFEKNESVTGGIRLAEFDGEKITTIDYHVQCDIGGHGYICTPYSTMWNSSNICFERSQMESQIFNFTVSADNSSNQCKGTTYLEADDPNVQIVHILDAEWDGYFRVKFTPEEVNSTEIFCRGSELITSTQKLAVLENHFVNPQLIKSFSDKLSYIPQVPQVPNLSFLIFILVIRRLETSIVTCWYGMAPVGR
ncbi:hypothetical protein Bhyg_08500, partial [Pseudolycoriella hygida]